MKYLLSFVDSPQVDLEYESILELEKFLEKAGLDGLEVVRCGASKLVESGMAIGLHLPFFNFWMDYYMQNEERIKLEFGSLEKAREFYQYKPEELHKYFLRDLEFANKYSEYAVFHVADVSNLEYLSRKHYYTDEEVLKATSELVNNMIEDSNYSKWLLFENLYFPGLQFNNLELTKRFIKSIEYEKIGFMLDIGHLMNTNTSIKNEEEGWKYVEEVYYGFLELKEYFKGIHLHVSVSGDYVEKIEKNPPKLPVDFYDRFEAIYEYVSHIDQHEISTSFSTNRVVNLISPEFLVLEFKASNRVEREDKAIRQMKILKNQRKSIMK